MKIRKRVLVRLLLDMRRSKMIAKLFKFSLACLMLGSIFGAFPSVVYGATQTELITNGGFESGLNGWNVSGDFHADPGFSYPHSGTRYAYLSTATGNPGNNLIGNMYQTVSIPSSATSATLTFWYNITTDETGSTPNDVLNVAIQDSAGAFLSTVAVWSNLNSQSIGNYAQKSFDLTPYVGQTIRINFVGTTNGSLPTVFRIDDVSVIATSPAPTISARIDDYSPGSRVDVTVGNSTPISVTFTNTGNTAWSFVAGATVWDSGGNEVISYSTTLAAALQPGQQTTISWNHTVNQAGDYWLQTAVWKATPYVGENLLDKEPSPSQNLIRGVSAPQLTISARIDGYSPSSRVDVTVGNSTAISVTFTNIGNTAWSFIAGATVWDSGGNEVISYSTTLATALQSGQQTTISWNHTVNQTGDYWLQFGIWKTTPYIAENLLDKKPDPSQNLIRGVSAPPPGDTISPANVTDLAVYESTTSSITLTWTSPGDDGNQGTASQYDIRYSTSEITEANWGSATQCTAEPSPQTAESSENFTITGLMPDTTYYFAMKTADEVSNQSGLSNVATGTTIAEGAKPVIVLPLEITPEKDSYFVGETLTARFSVINRGSQPITLDVLTVGGRLNGWCPIEECLDFTHRSVTLQSLQSYQYEGTLTLTHAGNYHFFIAYYID